VKSNTKELASILIALSRVANTFDPIGKVEDAGFSSPLLNDIVFAIPQIRKPVDGFLKDIDLKKAREGDLPNLWRDSEKYPAIEEAQMVRYYLGLTMNVFDQQSS
jgi:DNA mismatch repair protein MSH3